MFKKIITLVMMTSFLALGSVQLWATSPCENTCAVARGIRKAACADNPYPQCWNQAYWAFVSCLSSCDSGGTN